MGSLPGFLLALAGLAAQQPEPPRITVTTRLVQVSVVVEGKGARPVNDLTKEDFVVLDNGKPQAITAFVRSAGDAPAEAAAPPRDPGSPRTWSNRGPSGSGTPRTVTALVFDGLNTNLKHQAVMKDQMLRFLRNLRPGDSAALYLIGSDLRILHDFTDDSQALVRALEAHDSKMMAQWSRESVGGIMRGILRKNRASDTLYALRAIGEHLSRIPGRKNMVWVTSGFPMAIMEMENGRPGYMYDLRPEMAATAKAIGDADVALYPVSALGLLTQRSEPPEPRYPGRQRGMRTTATGPQIDTARQAGPIHDMMNSMAEETGGRAYTERNDLAAALQQATRDLTATYTLAFQPAHDQWNGDYRQLRVQVKRKGLKVRHRPGYVAAKEGPVDNRDAETVLMEAIDSPLDATGLGLAVSADRSASGATLRIRVDAASITLEPAEGRWKGQLLLAVVPLAPETGLAQPKVQKVGVDLSRERYDEVMKSGAAFETQVGTRDFAGGVRVFVLDVPSRRAGSVNVRESDGRQAQ